MREIYRHRRDAPRCRVLSLYERLSRVTAPADKYNYDDHAIQYNIFQMHQLGTHESHCSDVAICLYSFIDFEIVLIDFPLTDFKLVNVSSSADCQEMLSLFQWLNICAIFLSTANIALRNPWIPLDAHLVGAVIVCDAGIRRRFI